ncbi:phage tail tape measure protein [Streptomyces sp. CFMR 7]|uniref:phage tail tape measure protein n=1 Tax=Streptomyces sp. CFMR 7 TaxID=1649184 RepID=UPI0021B63D83|nr:phage tail tape measure protein [Streptomyces sp. CFMR 7]
MALLDELLVRIGMDTSGVDEGADQVTSKLEAMKGPAALAGAAAGGALALGLSAAMDITSARSSLRDQLGLTEAEAARAGDIAGDVYAAGFGGSLEDVTESVAAVGSSISDLGDLTDAEVEGMSKAALGLAKRIGVDVSDAASAAGNMVKNGLAKDGTEAFDVLAKAAETIPKSMRADLPAAVNEYGKHWARIGLDAKTAMGMMSQYVAAGGRDIDQAGDVLHEFARITSEEGERATDALKAMGLPAKQMLADINKGGPGAKAALQKTIEALRGVEDPAEQSALAVELFGDMAGESADALWAMDPATAATATGMDKAAGASKKMTDAMENDPAQQMDAAMRTLTQGLGEALLPALLKVSEFISNNKELMKFLVPVVLGLAVALGVFAAAVWVANLAMLASPVTWIILGIVALIAVIALIIVKWDAVAAATAAAWDWIVDKLGAAWDWIAGKLTAVWNWIVDKVSAAWDWIVQDVKRAVNDLMRIIGWIGAVPGKVAGWLGQVVSWVAGMGGRISRAAGGMWDSIVSGFKHAVNQLIRMWNGLSFTLGGGSFMGVGIPSVTLHTPDIPYLAEGGITTGPTLAMIGEGREDEVVLPLSRLEQMLDTGQHDRMRAPSTSKVEPLTARTVIELVGADSEFKDFFQKVVRDKAGGSVIRFAEG